MVSPACRLEIVQIQDLTSGFKGLLENELSDPSRYISNFLSGFTDELKNIDPHNAPVPKIKFGLTSFTDKPSPFLGIGWGTTASDVPEDWCYRLELPLADASIPREDAVTSRMIGDGDDYPNNQYQALMATAGDENLGWSNIPVDDDDTRVIKFALLVTDSPAHGTVVQMTDARSTNEDFNFASDEWKWPSIHPEARTPAHHHYLHGHDFWYAVSSYDYSYGLQSDVPPELAFFSPVDSTRAMFLKNLEHQFTHHRHCGPGSAILDAYLELSGRSYYRMTDDERLRWTEVLVHCDPVDLRDYLGIEPSFWSSDPLTDGRTHADGHKIKPTDWSLLDEGPSSTCLYNEYPNQEQAVSYLRAQGVNTIVAIPETEDNTKFDGLTRAKWLAHVYGACSDDASTQQCLADFYASTLIDADVIQLEEANFANQLGRSVAQHYTQMGCTAPDALERLSAPAPRLTFPWLGKGDLPTIDVCDRVTDYEWEVLEEMNRLRKDLGLDLFQIGRTAQLTAWTKAIGVHQSAYDGHVVQQCVKNSMHHWNVPSLENSYWACCYNNRYGSHTDGSTPTCMHHKVREMSQGELNSAVSYEITAGMNGSKCYEGPRLRLGSYYDPKELVQLWLDSPSHAALITGGTYWNKSWSNVGVGMGPCMAAVWFVEKADDDFICHQPRRLSK